jgi:hypothetical protein
MMVRDIWRNFRGIILCANFSSRQHAESFKAFCARRDNVRVQRLNSPHAGARSWSGAMTLIFNAVHNSNWYTLFLVEYIIPDCCGNDTVPSAMQ